MKLNIKNWVWALLATLLIGLRFVNLTDIPIFADEAIYIRWAQQIAYDTHQYFWLPMYDGKTPLYMWVLALFVGINKTDPLIVARVFNVLIGILTCGLLAGMAKKTWGDKYFYPAFLIGLVLPFNVFYSRLGLIDTMLAMWLTLSGSSLINYFKSNKWQELTLAGVWFSLAFLTKTSALYVLPVIVGLIGYSWIKSKSIKELWKWIGFGASLVISLVFLKTSTLFSFLFHRSSDFAYSMSEVIKHPFNIIGYNLIRVFKWFGFYLTWPVLLALGWNLTRLRLSDKEANRNLGLWMGVMLGLLLPYLITGKLLTSRYFLYLEIPVVMILTKVLTDWWSLGKITLKIGVGFVMVTMFVCGGLMITNPTKLKFPDDDVVQYFSSWSAGYGIKPIAEYISSRADAGKKVMVATEGFFGTLPDGLFVYLANRPELSNLEIHGIGLPVIGLNQTDRDRMTQYDEVYIVVNQHRLGVEISKLGKLVASYPKPFTGPNLLLIQVK